MRVLSAAAGSGLLVPASPASAADDPKAAALCINPELLVAKNTATGFTWTLASRLGDMLHRADDLLGERDSSYTILGIEFVADVPRLWYPGNRRHVVVQLHSSAAAEMSRACYQMAHETVHLLAPNGGGPATNLEEGIAAWFAGWYMRTQLNQPTWHPELPSYKRALALLSPVLDKDAHCIRRLRPHALPFSGICRDALLTEFPALTPADLTYLFADFDRRAR